MIILAAYILFASIFGYACRYAINPDGIAELRLAGYITEGKFLQSITSGWSPFIIWLYSLFIFAGFEGLTAARIAIALSGAGFLIAAWFLSARFNLSENVRFVALLIAALLISNWSIRNIGMDLLFAAAIISYLYLTTNPDILQKRKASFFCGLAGGLSYLAHHYALPFFIIHYPLMLLIRGYVYKDEHGFPLRRLIASWVVGVAGFLIIATMWIGVVSAKYGHLTISAKGSIAHAAMGPKDVDRRHPFFVGGLFKPNASYSMHVFEDPSEVKFKTWSPFESKEYFIHQLKLIKINAIYIINHFVTESPFFTYPLVMGILLLISVTFLLTTLNKEKKFLYLWVLLTFTVYCSGFLPTIARSPRRFYALMIIFLFISFHFVEELIRVVKCDLLEKKGKVLAYYLLLIVTLAFTIKPSMHLLRTVKDIISVEYVNPYKTIAKQINTVSFQPPYAIIRSSQKSHTDIYIAYYLNKQFLGRPLSRDADGIIRELKAADAKSLLVFDNQDIVERLKMDVRYVHLASIQLDRDIRYQHAVNIEQDEIKGWDETVSIFTVK